MLFKASAPGSLMLLGEYAVLHNQHALVCAIDKRLRVTLTPRQDEKIILESNLGQFETTLSQLKSVPPFQFVLTTLTAIKKNLKQGCHITIESEFSDTVGLGSSAAVTVATLAVLSDWLGLSLSTIEHIKLAREIIREVQGLGSGADVAASVLGGVVLYEAKFLLAKKIADNLPITVIYSGKKTPTVEAVQYVEKKFHDSEEALEKILESINECTLNGAAALHRREWKKLGSIMNTQQNLMDALGVNTNELDEIVKLLRQQSNVFGAKISGSGLGDCAIGLGECVLNSVFQQISVRVSSEGVRREKN